MENIENRLGVSTACFYPEATEAAFDKICGLGVRVCELFVNTHSETKPGYLRDIKMKADDSDIKIAAIHPYSSAFEPFLFFTEYDRRRFLDGIDFYRQYFEAAQFLSSDYIIFHGAGPSQVRLSVREYSDRFLAVAGEAKKYGCELLHENIGRINDYIQDLDAGIRFALDFKHSVSWNHDNAEIIGKMGENIAHIHLNDMLPADSRDKVSACRLPFRGGLDYGSIFGKLKDINYIGSFIIEVYRHNYGSLSEISDSIGEIRDFLKNAQS